MKKLFYTGFAGLLLFEILNVYLIMPMPGSQRMNSIDFAYFIYTWRWVFRGLFILVLIAGLVAANWKRKWVPALMLVTLLVIAYLVNGKMAADHMFYQPSKVLMAAAATNKVDSNRLVIGIVHNGEAKAYPVRFLGYHHQVQDQVGGKPVLVTYCTVCRTGRIFEPLINEKPAKFRLVGMDHFNAMFEDETTKSWWRQATGEAITGKYKGAHLPEFPSTQASLGTWLRLNPNSLVMRADPGYLDQYDTTLKYESGASRSKLTGTDSLSWKDKSWVVGLRVGDQSRAYDWLRLKKERIINDRVGDHSLLLVLAKDDQSFFAFNRVSPTDIFSVSNDTLHLGEQQFLVNGQGINGARSLTRLPAYQEFWHSWRTFNPATTKY